MSDLSIYELEDIIWDDFERNGDHIVPHSNNDEENEEKSCKKPRHEEAHLQSNKGNFYASGSVSQVKERNPKSLNKEKNTMEKAVYDDADMANDVASGDNKLSNNSLKSSNINSGSESCTDDLNLFSNGGDGKEASDLLYYGWPDIGNFEDVERMLSNCDSSLGLGVTGNDDELVWFTSDDPAGGYEEALKMDFEFPCSEPSALMNLSQDHEPRESDNNNSCFLSENKDEFKLKDQKEQSSQQNHGEIKKADHSLGNYALKGKDIHLSSNDESDQVFTSIGNQQQTKITEHDSFDYMQSNSYLHLRHDHVPMQTTGGPMITGIKSEDNDSQKETSSIDHGSSNKKLHTPNKIEGQSDVEGVTKIPSAEVGSLDVNVPEGSTISSELDEISLEATSFRQLKQVMEQLDLRTKLCIRDSLYRLAQSAEQRHNYAGINNNTTNCGDANGPLIIQGTNKCTGFMDMETDTNPIDRTIAHLLFHRPSESSNMPIIPSPLKPNAKVHGSTIMVADKQSCEEETTNESADKISST